MIDILHHTCEVLASGELSSRELAEALGDIIYASLTQFDVKPLHSDLTAAMVSIEQDNADLPASYVVLTVNNSLTLAQLEAQFGAAERARVRTGQYRYTNRMCYDDPLWPNTIVIYADLDRAGHVALLTLIRQER